MCRTSACQLWAAPSACQLRSRLAYEGTASVCHSSISCVQTRCAGNKLQPWLCLFRKCHFGDKAVLAVLQRPPPVSYVTSVYEQDLGGSVYCELHVGFLEVPVQTWGSAGVEPAPCEAPLSASVLARVPTTLCRAGSEDSVASNPCPRPCSPMGSVWHQHRHANTTRVVGVGVRAKLA